MITLLAAAWLAIAAPLTTPQAPAVVPPAAAGAQFTARAQDVLAILRGGGDPQTIFTPQFLAQVSPDQFTAVRQQLTAQYGAVQGIEGVTAGSGAEASVRVGFERAVVELRVVLAAAPPHRIAGMSIAGVQPRGNDSVDALIADLRALPGRTALLVARLDPGGPAPLAQLNPDAELAIGSAFKLVILAELSQQIAAGRHRWDEVAPLGARSLPSGITQAWPQGTPMTIQSLASLMISISDNTATDTLLALAGRENVERMMSTIGFAHPERNRPFLSTREAFAIKINPALLAAWTHADEGGRRLLLAIQVAAVRADGLDPAAFVGPQSPDKVEWFASVADLARTMDWLRRNGDATTRSILSISPGMAPNVAGAYAYAGFKGGSETGIITLTYLLRTRARQWYVVSGGANNFGGTVDEARFVGLIARALQLVR